MYSLFDEKCSPGMKTQVEGSSGIKIIKAGQDGIKILGITRDIMFGVQHHLNNTWDVVNTDKCLYTL